MDTGRLRNNKKYGGEIMDDTEIIFSLKEDSRFKLHLWDGYFDDIFLTHR